MISVMNNDSEFDKISDRVEENRGNVRVSGGNGGDSVDLGASDEAKASLMEVDSVAEDENKKEMDSRVFEMKTGSEIDAGIGSPEVKNEGFDEFGDEDERREQMGLKVDTVSDYKSLLSEFDDYVASEKMGTGISRALSYGFEVGDMVWGKVKSHPWWPGHIFNEAFASSSVRRTRRVGYVLVAFFGDSSYGWFDPAELIPFEPHFAEKSQQMISRNFVRAVEEAIDEASRRTALGLACKCRSPYNFRPTSVEGYYAVDVPDYEAQAVYSTDQIEKARESFGPRGTLSFVKQLAAAPHESDLESIDFIKNKATVFALRKAVFEEFDETYAQAFGVQFSRPSVNTLDQPLKDPPRAPLSGPLVIAEALGDGKSSKKPVKIKDNSKYVLKRRHEAVDSRTVQFGQVQAGSAASLPGYADGSSAGDYVLQRRDSARTPIKGEQGVFVSKYEADSSDVSGREALSIGAEGPSVNGKPLLEKESNFLQESSEGVGQDAIISPGHGEIESMASLKYGETGNMSRADEGFQQTGPGPGVHPFTVEAKNSAGCVLKEVKGSARPLDDLSPETSALKPKKKKKKIKESESEANSDQSQKKMSLASGKSGAKVGSMYKKSAKLPSTSGENSRVNLQKKDIEVPELLSGLQAVALDPFHGAKKNISGAIRRFFLRFRSLVYQKSLGISSTSDTEAFEGQAIRPSSAENAPDMKASMQAKTSARPDDQTKVGKKRLPSDRQEEIAAKKLKKINQLKSLAAEKKAGQRTAEAPKPEGKEQPGVGTTPAKPGKEQSGAGPTHIKAAKTQPVKRAGAPQPKVVEPTMLVMKFPPGTSLPSAAQLKARFGRFGLLDQSAIRVFWKSFTCRVVFMYKSDAQTAYRYATGNNSLFGNVNVRYFLRDVEASAAEGPESNKGKGDDPTSDLLRAREPPSEWPGPAPTHQPVLLLPPVQLKSCLKRPTSDDQASGNGNGGRGTARVKFMLAGEETPIRTEPSTVASRNNFQNNNNNNNNCGSYGDAGGPSSSSVAMEFNSKNFQNVGPPPSSSSLPPPILAPQFAKTAPRNNLDQHVVESPAQPRNFHNLNSQSAAAPPTPSVDISQQMISLLTRCNDVVANVTGLLGYVPYHPL